LFVCCKCRFVSGLPVCLGYACVMPSTSAPSNLATGRTLRRSRLRDRTMPTRTMTRPRRVSERAAALRSRARRTTRRAQAMAHHAACAPSEATLVHRERRATCVCRPCWRGGARRHAACLRRRRLCGLCRSWPSRAPLSNTRTRAEAPPALSLPRRDRPCAVVWLRAAPFALAAARARAPHVVAISLADRPPPVRPRTPTTTTRRRDHYQTAAAHSRPAAPRPRRARPHYAPRARRTWPPPNSGRVSSAPLPSWASGRRTPAWCRCQQWCRQRQSNAAVDCGGRARAVAFGTGKPRSV
jgi:hypothetical protein